MGYLEALCKIGPRISGSEGMKKQQEMLEKHFKDQGGKIRLAAFHRHAKQRSPPAESLDGQPHRLLASRPRSGACILCSHYDTRPIADQEPDPRDWRKPFLSANDGGSGVALLMELAHHMKDMKTQRRRRFRLLRRRGIRLRARR